MKQNPQFPVWLVLVIGVTVGSLLVLMMVLVDMVLTKRGCS